MRTTLQLAKIAIGDSSFTAIEQDRHGQSPWFHVYKVHLPVDKFRGIPTEWVFVVLDPASVNAGQTEESILANVYEIIEHTPHSTPVLVINDVPRLQLCPDFIALPRNVFCLDARTLPTTQKHDVAPRQSPLAMAIRQKFPSATEALLKLSPYQREKPVSGWQFFGRERELRELANTSENIVIVGARRIGKTSLMLEAARRMKELGERVYYLSVQNVRNSGEVVSALLSELAPSEKAAAVRRQKAMDEQLLSVVLRNATTQQRRLTLLLDELGNVISGDSLEDRKLFGLLREWTQGGQVRVIMSCFQELSRAQQQAFSGPLVNFAATMRLGVFSDREVEEIIIAPWEFWKPLAPKEKERLLEIVVAEVGCHPFFLQFFGYALFDQLKGQASPDILLTAKRILRKDLPQFFDSPVEEVFYRIPSAMLTYLFLERGSEAAQRKDDPLHKAVIDDDWVQRKLASLGYETTVAARRNLLDAMEIHGLTCAQDGARSKQRITVPVVYHFVARMESPLSRYVDKLKMDIADEVKEWNLQPLRPTAGGT